MSEEILTQIIGVSHRCDMHGNEGLIYAPAPLLGDDSPAPEPIWRSIKSLIIPRYVERIRHKIEELNWRARLTGNRDDTGIEPDAAALAACVLPEKGFVSVVQRGVHPQFDIIYDAASTIPWEVLEENYFLCRCQQPQTLVQVVRNLVEPRQIHCQLCGKPMQAGGGKLAVEYHLSHLVRGGEASRNSGSQFLIIEDPTSDLTNGETDPQGACKKHLEELKRLIVEAGFQLSLLKGRNATTQRVLAAIANPELAGIYYFGHGFFPKKGDQGCLLLADGPLFAGEIERQNSSAQFVFLNACEGASSGEEWSLERKFRSVGHAFARGGSDKTVIAPLWPVINLSAAAFAGDVIRAVLEGNRFGDSTKRARQQSLERYKAGAADISWMAYRYFGNPNRMLPRRQTSTKATAGAVGSTECQLFDAADNIKVERFGFGVEAVLLRAAKRRNAQNRQLVTLSDFLAGLIRTGHLTRYAFRCGGTDPDAAYRSLLQSPEDDSGRPYAPAELADGPDADLGMNLEKHAEKLRTVLSRSVVRNQAEFSEELLELLVGCDRRADKREGRRQKLISERDVLASIIRSHWDSIAITLPAADDLLTWLDAPEVTRSIDQNGKLILAALSPMARRVIESAHELAEQRGAGSIKDRLLLASFFREADGHAATTCRNLGIDASRVATFLVAGTESQPPTSFLLSPESAQKVVIPMLIRARNLQKLEKQKVITEATLFLAYCDIASPEFKNMLRLLPSPLGFDLDALRNATSQPPGTASALKSAAIATPPSSSSDRAVQTDPPSVASKNLSLSELDSGARALLAMAAECARIQGYREIRSVHLFAGWLAVGSHTAQALVQQSRIRVERLMIALLRMVRPAAGGDPTEDKKITVSQNTGEILSRAISQARKENRSEANELDIVRAILSDPKGAVPTGLKALGLKDWLTDARLASLADDQPMESTSSTSLLESLGRNLTQCARDQHLIRPVQRNKEINRLVVELDGGAAKRILLVGPRGVGRKTTVEGLADWIVDGMCPDSLASKEVIELSGYVLGWIDRDPDIIATKMSLLAQELTGDRIIFVTHFAELISSQLGVEWLAQLMSSGGPLIACVTAVEHEQFESTYPSQYAAFAVHAIEPPTSQEAVSMVEVHRQLLERQHGLRIESHITPDVIVHCSKRPEALPGIAVQLLSKACSFAVASPGREGTVTKGHLADALNFFDGGCHEG